MFKRRSQDPGRSFYGSSNIVKRCFVQDYRSSTSSLSPRELQDDDHRAWSCFSISKSTFERNIIKISDDEAILQFLFKSDFIHSNAIFFCQLHYDNVTSHSFLYS